MSGRTRVKICGLTRPEHAVAAVEAGAWAVGVVFADGPRKVDIPTAVAVLANVPEEVKRVGVFVDPAMDDLRAAVVACGLSHVQLHASGLQASRIREDIGCGVVRGVPFRDPGDVVADGDIVLYDAAVPGMHGGTGVKLDWRALADADPPRPFGVAGGLNAGNVGAAIAALRPDLVDVSSGVEASPGIKDPRRIAEFCAAVVAAETTRQQGTE